jgi:hypothetical protein
MKNKKLWITGALLLLSLWTWAQPGPPADPTPLPGIAWLIAAGAALGGKKWWDKRKEGQPPA